MAFQVKHPMVLLLVVAVMAFCVYMSIHSANAEESKAPAAPPPTVTQNR